MASPCIHIGLEPERSHHNRRRKDGQRKQCDHVPLPLHRPSTWRQLSLPIHF